MKEGGLDEEKVPVLRLFRLADRQSKQSKDRHLPPIHGELSAPSLAYLRETGLAHRKRWGQYFTPRSVRAALLAHLPKYGRGARIIDPACGTGEFLLSAREFFPGASLAGVEIDPPVAGLARQVVPGADIRCADALSGDEAGRYDAVIGNPPYFEFQPSVSLRARYEDILRGRPNVFALFVKRGLDLLKDGGCLGYVIPPSMNNGAYFARLREFIVANADIRHLGVLPSETLFTDAQQTVMILVLQKKKNSGRYVFRRRGITLFSEKAGRLHRAFEGARCLHELGFRVKTGPVVWNQHRERLTDSPSGAVPLIWAHNIGEEGLSFPVRRPGKPQYIRIGRMDRGPALVVNRITGAAEKARLKSALVPTGMTFVGENHVNIVYREKTSGSAARREWEELNRQIRSPEVRDVVRAVTGNTQISKNELEFLLPIRVGQKA